MNLILIGAPAAGKGSVAEKLVEDYNLVSISSGALFRAEIASGSELGLKLQKIIKSGSLVPDDLTFEFVKERLEKEDCKIKGFILDGYPRSIRQAQILDEYLSSINKSIDKVIYIDVENEKVLERISGRRLCRSCGAIYNINTKPSTNGNRCDKCNGELYQRDEDNVTSVLRRISSFQNDTFPIIGYYQERGLVYKVDGNHDFDYTLKEVHKVLDKENK